MDAGQTPGNPHVEAGALTAGAPLDRARAGAILVHGRGSGPQSVLEGLVGPLALPDVAYVLPAAAGQSWYPRRFIEPREANEPWLGWALEALEACVASVVAGGVPVERIVVVGFSQGACLVTECCARRPRPYAGVAALTGGLIGSDEEAAEPLPALDGLPFLLATSDQDAWVPIERVRATAAALERAGAHVDLRVVTDPEHRVRPDEVTAVRTLLERATER
jgi:predicted esterase